MCKVQDVADFFVDSALNDPEDNMTNLRVNKLLFFAQGWSLARRHVQKWRQAGLSDPSNIRISKFLRLEQKDFRRKIGTLRIVDIAGV